jgi:hypothetical protein
MYMMCYSRQRLSPGILPMLFRIMLVATVLFATLPQSRASDGDEQHLRAYYQTVREAMAHSALRIPLTISSQELDDVISADVSALLPTDFNTFADLLSRPASWCQFVPLNPNIKACTYTQHGNPAGITFYAGGKQYQSAARAQPLYYHFEVQQRSNDYLHILLTSPQGPMDTEDHRIEVYALRVDQKTFLRIHSSYRESLSSQMVTRLYLATLGRNKVGFSTTGTDAQGNPVYVQGVKGIIERSVVRYALAVRAFLDTQSKPAEQRFEARIASWYDLAEQFPRQLHGMARATYLDIKRREHANQLELQARLRNMQ